MSASAENENLMFALCQPFKSGNIGLCMLPATVGRVQPDSPNTLNSVPIFTVCVTL